MDNDDVLIIQEAVKAVTVPLQTTVAALALKVDALPCGEHKTSIVKIETEHTVEKELKKDLKTDTKDKKDWWLKLILAALILMEAARTYGFFRGLVK